ncbi:MAG: ATP-binding protein, partial [Acidobacteriota bacterium]
GKGVETLEFDSRDQVITARFSPIGDREAVAGLVIVFHDVTELRRLEDLRKEFISNISHELKTPLTSIKGFSETLLDEEGFELRHRDFIRRIHQNSNQLSEMIDDLFSLARLETGDPRIEFGPVDFESLMTDLRAAFADLLNPKGLQLTWTNSAGSKTFIAGERYIRRVFENLIQNAIQYTDNGGIDIGFSDLGEELRFTVRDTGKGIPRQDLERVFERFYRVDKDRSRSTGGPGIGLAIVKHIVHLHGGRVWAESQLKCGTAIHFTLPRSSQSSD